MKAPTVEGCAEVSCLRDLEEVEDELCSLAGHIAAATARFLALLAEFDRREGWAGTGIRSCAHWLSWKCSMDLRTAREHVRVARSLEVLPVTAATFAQGRLSYSKARAIARVADKDTEQDLVDIALHAPAAHLDRLVRGLRTLARQEDEDQGEGRGPDPSRWRVQHRWDDETGDLVIWGRLSAQDGAVLLAGLTRVELERVRTNDGDEPDLTGPSPADLGPALAAMAQVALDATSVPLAAPTAEVIVINDRDGSHVEAGPALSEAAEGELFCGAHHRHVGTSGGAVLAYGRRRRAPSPAQLRALHLRDGCCQTPGCGRTRFLHAHHVRFWRRGGETDLDNLILLCGSCHRALHLGRFAISALGRQRFEFRDIRGRVWLPAPPIEGLAEIVLGGGVAPDAITPDWAGDPLRLGYATSVLTDLWRARGPDGAPAA